MPKIKFQDFIFAIIMVITMVYCMTLYNMVLESELNYSTFLNAFFDMWYEAIVAFLAQKFVAGPIVKKLVFRSLKPGVDKPIFITVVIAGFTVSMMAPMMTLFVTILHNGFVKNVPLLWLPKLALNFPFALCIQIFYIGPLVRFIFRTIFKNQLSTANSPLKAVQEM
ncbi:DUF2798 domain-containing protein [Clostridium sp. PL3]|uniref:DUF2798 domain-containing protein n=1 Tax=Clostridium thailandense TaxID=2794346 RepID=A0A949TGK5_9CLOT|nr:DUF2798 domain-containing protein [Clostridium thailandense]MBV7272409.1 DUF2798 domain-containing protein [Clostridium thailandense]